jgi:predicted Zn-ribbon and HTH transcriptional regulator
MMNLNPKIKPEDMKPIVCANCGGLYFRQVVAINKVSRLLTGEAQDSIIPVPTFRCDDCGYIPEEFRPIEQSKPDNNENS